MTGEKLGPDQPSRHPCASLGVEEADSHLSHPSPRWPSNQDRFKRRGQGASAQHGAFTPFILHSFTNLYNAPVDQIKQHQCPNSGL